MAVDRAHTLRGAAAGAVAAGVWAAQQPLDQKAFRFPYDDVALLGKAVTRGSGWRAVGTAMHLANGAVFGALYANVAPRLPLPAWARGPFLGLAENFGFWPLAAVLDKVHPARDELPPLAGSGRALAQATWRHLLFGVVLGELERRLNPPGDDGAPPYEHLISTNGHGSIEHAVSGA